MDWKIELVAIPVTDVDRAKAFYVNQVGFNADHDYQVSETLRFVQLTPTWTATPGHCRNCHHADRARSRPYSCAMTGEVSPLGRDDEVASPDQLRASHEDRDRVVELLRVAAGDGRLTAEELDERLEVALTARTYGELAALATDLPAAAGFATDTPVPKP